ncbi:AAA family ATPase [Sphingobacterium sp.]|uniref:AAA family ATPase n=1 Tax=Sphingobacterium sp. TaxID=341027 RepID=UPI00289746B5|nr:AAA family ATPase [Sphingobacterium sp.]
MIYISQIRNKNRWKTAAIIHYNIPSLSALNELKFRNPVTFIVGENGIGKSTLVEAIAINAGFNPEGGSRNFNFSTMDSHSALFEDIHVIQTAYRNRDGYFLRAESFYNVATAVDQYEAQKSYGGSLHERSHGESFLSLLNHRLNGNGLYILMSQNRHCLYTKPNKRACRTEIAIYYCNTLPHPNGLSRS